MSTTRRPGVTMVELIVVLAMLGVMAAVTGLAASAALRTGAITPIESRIAALRDSALALGRQVTATLVNTDTAAVTIATAYPDGRVVTTVPGVSHITGRKNATHHVQ